MIKNLFYVGTKLLVKKYVGSSYQIVYLLSSLLKFVGHIIASWRKFYLIDKYIINKN